MANLLKGSSPPLRWIVHPHDIADRAAQRQIKHEPHAAQICAKVVVGKWYLINHLHIGRQRLLRPDRGRNRGRRTAKTRRR